MSREKQSRSIHKNMEETAQELIDNEKFRQRKVKQELDAQLTEEEKKAAATGKRNRWPYPITAEEYSKELGAHEGYGKMLEEYAHEIPVEVIWDRQGQAQAKAHALAAREGIPSYVAEGALGDAYIADDKAEEEY